MDVDILPRIEKQRLELENNIASLRKSLRHWQILEIDYEGLKEEFQLLDETASQDECLQAARDFKPELIDDKELQSLVEDKQTSHNRRSQLINVLTKRVEYVTRNVSTIRKQLSDAEKKRNALLLAQNPEHQDEAALPLNEITEELDDDGRVISSKVQTPGQGAPDLLEVLRKAGVSDIKDSEVAKAADLTKADTKLENEKTSSEQIGHEGGIASSNTASILDSIAQSDSVSSHHREAEDEDQNEDADDEALGPKNANDSEEDAALRQEMLQYGMEEVGAIVAELDLRDAGNLSYDEDEDDDYLSDYDENEDLYTDESEDERGATRSPVISERYKRQMEALSKQHGIKDLQNLGPEPVLSDSVKEQLGRPPAAEAARQAALAREKATKGSIKHPSTQDQAAHKPAKKKKVAFAPSLDIAREQPAQKSGTSSSTPSEPQINPVGEIVIERTAGEANTASSAAILPPSTPQKISRFKAARANTPSTPMFPPPMDFPTTNTKTTPSGPPNRTISNTLIERPSSNITTPADPSDFDEELHRREVAVEYQKHRNRKIHEQGGYVKGGEDDNYGDELAAPVVIDENTGKPRKISRFKAARMQS